MCYGLVSEHGGRRAETAGQRPEGGGMGVTTNVLWVS